MASARDGSTSACGQRDQPYQRRQDGLRDAAFAVFDDLDPPACFEGGSREVAAAGGDHGDAQPLRFGEDTGTAGLL